MAWSTKSTPIIRARCLHPKKANSEITNDIFPIFYHPFLYVILSFWMDSWILLVSNLTNWKGTQADILQQKKFRCNIYVCVYNWYHNGEMIVESLIVESWIIILISGNWISWAVIWYKLCITLINKSQFLSCTLYFFNQRFKPFIL